MKSAICSSKVVIENGSKKDVQSSVMQVNLAIQIYTGNLNATVGPFSYKASVGVG